MLRLAFAANIVILLPVVAALFVSGTATIFGAGVPDSPPLRLLLASLWGAILVCSALGLIWPRAMIGILAMQVIYKACWLIAFVLPTFLAGMSVPWGPALTFLPIVILWPILLFRVAASAPGTFAVPADVLRSPSSNAGTKATDTRALQELRA